MIPLAKIKVSGPDAEKFLQGQLTCNVHSIDDNPKLAAYCDIKGRVEAIFYINIEKNSFYLQLPKEIAEQTLEELKKYAVFSKVELKIQDINNTYNEKEEIESGIPQVYNSTRSLFFAHDLNLPELGAVSFTKGCFRGQEIIARMQNRGNIKRKMYKFNIDGSCSINEKIVDSNNKPVGIVVRVNKNIGLGVINNSNTSQQLFVGRFPIVIY